MLTPPHIVVSVPPWPAGLEKVRQLATGSTVRFVDAALATGEWPLALIRDASVLLCEVPPPNASESLNLEWIQLGSAGYEQLAGLPLRARGVRVTNASGANDVPIAEWCLTMMVMFERDFRRLLDNQRCLRLGSRRSFPVGTAREAGWHHRLRQHRSRNRACLPLPGLGTLGYGPDPYRTPARSLRAPRHGRRRRRAASTQVHGRPDGRLSPASRLSHPDHAAHDEHPRHHRRARAPHAAPTRCCSIRPAAP